LSARSERIPLKGGAEYDAFSRWKNLLCYLQRAGAKKSIKRQYNKRLRRYFNEEIKNSLC